MVLLAHIRDPTDSNHKFNIAPNLLNRDFTADKPNQKWVVDISYIWTREGWLYLAAVLDLHSRRIIGWSVSNRIRIASITVIVEANIVHMNTRLGFANTDLKYQCQERVIAMTMQQWKHSSKLSRLN